MNFKEYIVKTNLPEDFCSSGLHKELYLDIMDLAFNAYPITQLAERTQKYESTSVDDIQAFSRITATLGQLIANGRRQEHFGLWQRMMDICLQDISKKTDDIRLDFAVKELLLVFKAMKPYVAEEKIKFWLGELGKINPDINYSATLEKFGVDGLHNINIFNMVGEFLRESEGLTDTKKYFAKHWPIQLCKFDENGMYMDPDNPILYDIVTRMQIELLLFFGYDGEFSKALDERLEQSAFYTLFMQSSNFEIPYGGRSNQFLFNDACIAAHCEYEARRYKARGDLKIAGMFKRCAHFSMKAVLRWLNEVEPPKHIKNFFPIESKHGEEVYAYYDKYMITLAANTYYAYLFADDSIEEFICPSEAGGYVFETSNAFHKIFANCMGNFIEIDTMGDHHYDSTGLGRYHKAGIPSELALSMPLTATPRYTVLDGFLKENMSICPGWDDGNGGIQYLCDLSEELEVSLEIIKVDRQQVSFIVTYTGNAIMGCKGIKEQYTLDHDGVAIKCQLVQPCGSDIYYRVPVFYTNGKDVSSIDRNRNELEVTFNHFQYIMKTNGSIKMNEDKYTNRNGAYLLASIKKENAIKLDLCLNLMRNEDAVIK